jgi:hypothetical protein
MSRIQLTPEAIIRFALAGLRIGNVDAVIRLLEDFVKELDRRGVEEKK